MGNYPKGVKEIFAAMDQWNIPETFDQEFVDAFDAASSHRSPVQMIAAVFDLLKDRDDLDQGGQELLQGCAHMIAEYGLCGRAPAALLVLGG